VNPELPTPSPLDRKQGFLCARYIDFANSLSSVILEVRAHSSPHYSFGGDIDASNLLSAVICLPLRPKPATHPHRTTRGPLARRETQAA